jgi:hypothetical protein
MTAFNRFTFFGYLLRPATEKDRPLAKEWNDKDEDHAGMVDPYFWTRQGPGEDAYLLVDQERDGPLFFLKLVQMGKCVIELHIQFSHEGDKKARARRREALMEGLMWLERALRVGGVKEIFFRSRNSGLILYSTKRLKFIADPVMADGETLLRKAL